MAVAPLDFGFVKLWWRRVKPFGGRQTGRDLLFSMDDVVKFLVQFAVMRQLRGGIMAGVRQKQQSAAKQSPRFAVVLQ